MNEGIVYRSTGSWCSVKTNQGFYDCIIKGKFRLKGIKSTNPIAVGDRVLIEIEQEEKRIGSITSIKERTNYIVRKSVNLSKQMHIIAANIDQAFLLVTLNNPPTFTSFIDRFLVTAEAYHIRVILLFNKIDTYSTEERRKFCDLRNVYERIGYSCYEISAPDELSVAKVKNLMKGKVNMFSGHSGVGKSTLINTIASNLDLRTAAINEQLQSGQHTTTFAEMFDLREDIKIIDTPGIKGFGIVNISSGEIGNYFPEFFKLKPRCKFGDCLHVSEPKCAVIDAIKSGTVATSRYQSYIQLLEEETPYRN